MSTDRSGTGYLGRVARAANRSFIYRGFAVRALQYPAGNGRAVRSRYFNYPPALKYLTRDAYLGSMPARVPPRIARSAVGQQPMPELTFSTNGAAGPDVREPHTHDTLTEPFPAAGHRSDGRTELLQRLGRTLEEHNFARPDPRPNAGSARRHATQPEGQGQPDRSDAHQPDRSDAQEERLCASDPEVGSANPFGGQKQTEDIQVPGESAPPVSRDRSGHADQQGAADQRYPDSKWQSEVVVPDADADVALPGLIDSGPAVHLTAGLDAEQGRARNRQTRPRTPLIRPRAVPAGSPGPYASPPTQSQREQMAPEPSEKKTKIRSKARHITRRKTPAPAPRSTPAPALWERAGLSNLSFNLYK